MTPPILEAMVGWSTRTVRAEDCIPNHGDMKILQLAVQGSLNLWV